MPDSLTSDLIQRIRDRSTNYPELKEAHHFVFDCPLDRSYQGPSEYVWLSVYPSEGDDDWNLCPHNTEETRDYNFQLEHGRSIGSQRRLKKLRWFLGDELYRLTTLTMQFFWSVKNTGTDFTERFGYTFNRHPHWNFCIAMNLELIDRIRPRAVFAERRRLLNRYEHEFGLNPVHTHYGRDGNPLLEERRFGDGTPFLCFDNLSARHGHEEARSLVNTLVHEIE